MDTVILQELRLDIDALYQLIEPLEPIEDDCIESLYSKSDELKEVSKSLFLSKAWCGKLIGELGGTSPYKNDGNRKSVSDIEHTDSQAQYLENVIGHYLSNRKNSWSDKNYIEKIDKLRELVDYVSNKFIKSYASCESILITIIFMHIQESKLWLGFELGRIRNQAQKEIDIEARKMELREGEMNINPPIKEMNNDELNNALNG